MTDKKEETEGARDVQMEIKSCYLAPLELTNFKCRQ